MEDIKQFISKMRHTHNQISNSFGPKLNEDVIKFGLSMSHFMVMATLVKKQYSPIITEIAKELSITYPTMTNLVDYLEDKKLVQRERDKKDRRAIRIGLTNRGMKLMEEINHDWETNLEAFLTGLTEEDRSVFMNATESLLNLALKYSKKMDERQSKG
jgi:DNA-binding MarR family transcriptional regulator